MRKLGCLLTLALLWAGSQGVYQGMRNRSPQALTCEQAEATTPTSAWVQLSGCRVNVLEAAYKSGISGPRGKIFLPLRSRSSTVKTVRLVLATEDPAIVAVVEEMEAQGDDQGKQIQFMARNIRRLILDKDVSGMIQSGIDKDDKIHRRLAELNKELAADFVVVEEGKEPGLLKSLLLLAGGVGLLLLIGLTAASKGEAPKAA